MAFIFILTQSNSHYDLTLLFMINCVMILFSKILNEILFFSLDLLNVT